MSVQLLEKLTMLGKEMGYAGIELREWVSSQMKADEKKEAAALEREERRIKREEQQREIAARAQQELSAREAERAEREAERAERIRIDEKAVKQQEAERAERLKMEELSLNKEIKLAELRLAEKKLEKQESESEASTDGETSHASLTTRKGKPGPKLPHFEENRDNIDSYLRRFERYAALQSWPQSEWAIYLSALLKGKALEVYSRMPEAESRSYEKLKAALLRKYQLTVDGFRKQFYSARREKEETASQFVCRLEGYLDRWIQLAKIEQSFEGLRDLIVREQFFSVSEEHLTIYLRERDPKETSEMTKLADMYLEARLHREWNREKKHKESSYKKPSRESERANERRTEDKAATENKSFSRGEDRRVCYQCRQVGHTRKYCPMNRREYRGSGPTQMASACQVLQPVCPHEDAGTTGRLRLECGCEVPYVGSLSSDLTSKVEHDRLPVVSGKVNGHSVSVLRDTGCTTVVIRRDLVADRQMTGETRCYRMLDGSIGRAETAEVYIESPVFTGKCECLCIQSPTCDIVIGNVPGAELVKIPETAAVTTRAQKLAAGKPKKSLIVPEFGDLQVSRADIQRLQNGSIDLKKYFEFAESGETIRSGKVATVRYVVRRDLLYRVYQVPNKCDISQLVVPNELRRSVLKLAHDSIMSGHEGINKTVDRVLSQFWWPGVHGDVTRYCRSCDVCQRTIPRGRVPKAPLQKMPVISVPFQRIGVDLIGPITPLSSSGKRYILTAVDYATRYPEAVALSGISTEEVAEALCGIYSRVGIPTQVVHDQGTQFMSDVMVEVSRLLSVQNLVSTPYHPQCNGLVERYNGTLKAMLKKLCAERPQDWDRYLDAVLFAYREVKQESVGFSPFELLYGRTVRGPMSILRELWTNEDPSSEVRTTYQYVLDLRNRLEETCQLVKESLENSAHKAKKHFDKKTRMRELCAGDSCLILLPTASSKLLMQWKGPYHVTERVGPTDYRVEVGDSTKVYHINMLKKYFAPTGVSKDIHNLVQEVNDGPEVIAATVLEEGPADELEMSLPGGDRGSSETVNDVHVSDELKSEQQKQLWQLLRKFEGIFSDRPGLTHVAEHQIVLTDNNPIRCKPYPVPHAIKDSVVEEVREMQRLGVIEKSNSPYASPLLMVKKKDGSNRPVVDFRRLNKITIFDAEPMPNVDDIYARLAPARYFSKLDFCKGYWQIPMSDEDKPKTAFSTPLGLHQFTRMPFGLQNAGATYGRMMRKVLDGMQQTDNFVDDVLSFTGDWQIHLKELEELFGRVCKSGLTVKPSKCFFGYSKIDYVGHTISRGCLHTMEDKVERIVSAPVPKTKKQLRSFLGLAGYYRRFVPSYATVAAPLTDLLKKGAPNKLTWDPAQDMAFRELKAALSSQPVLRLPDFTKQFIVRTDASDQGLGAILLQEHEDGIFPVLYLSRKLNAAERNYSVIERECLAVVWAIRKLQVYLYGREFVLQTDHRPLTFLDQAKLANARVMRWAMVLQPYRYRTESIKGSDNVGADYLSRAAQKAEEGVIGS